MSCGCPSRALVKRGWEFYESCVNMRVDKSSLKYVWNSHEISSKFKLIEILNMFKVDQNARESPRVHESWRVGNQTKVSSTLIEIFERVQINESCHLKIFEQAQIWWERSRVDEVHKTRRLFLKKTVFLRGWVRWIWVWSTRLIWYVCRLWDMVHKSWSSNAIESLRSHQLSLNFLNVFK